MNLSSLRSGNFDERTEKINEFFLRKMKNVFLAEKVGIILNDGNFVGKKLAYMLAVFCEG